ncbi:MAG: tryptophan synthase subunit beta [Candidatus Heimdallarchaeota archaeon]|nr:tryptophan synthase subunit beta [Candidatus Heimdallarchaeota archaeon]
MNGYFGNYGGRFAPEILIPALEELETAFDTLKYDPNFNKKLHRLQRDFSGRPTPLFHAKRLSDKYGTDIYFKREDLLHGGAHKINNVLGQGLLAEFIGKKRIIAETGAGQHGVATAIIGAALGLETEIFMGEIDIARQQSNVERMKILGAKVIPVKSGSRTLKDAVNAALRNWISTVDTTHYLIGSVVGPHPFPLIVRSFQSIIGIELKEQMKQLDLNPTVIACLGGGSNAAGTFYPLIDDNIELIGVEAGGKGLNLENGASLSNGSTAIFHGMKSFALQNDHRQILEAYSISAGLDYPGVGPEHAFWNEIGRVRYLSITDEQAISAMRETIQLEGIIPALESSHAIAQAIQIAKEGKTREIVVTLSGRGDKDIGVLIE